MNNEYVSDCVSELVSEWMNEVMNECNVIKKGKIYIYTYKTYSKSTVC